MCQAAMARMQKAVPALEDNEGAKTITILQKEELSCTKQQKSQAV